MRNEFIPYKEALALKELGFDEPCFYMWNIDTKELFSSNSTDINGQPTNLDLIGNVDFTAPLYQQAFRWFREKYKLFGEVNLTTKQKYFGENLESVEFFVLNVTGPLFESNDYTIYEEAELACLKKLIEIVNQNKDDE